MASTRRLTVKKIIRTKLPSGKYLKGKFEPLLVQELISGKVSSWEYEPRRLKYIVPVRECYYYPDFEVDKLLSSGKITIEAKGYFRGGKKERDKYVLVSQQYPDLDLRFVFQDAYKHIGKSKKSMQYWQWAEANGFKWAHNKIPKSWLKEML